MRVSLPLAVFCALALLWPTVQPSEAAAAKPKGVKPAAAKKAKPEASKKTEKASPDKAAATKPVPTKAAPKPDAPDKASLHEVKRGPMKIDVRLSGQFEAAKMEPVAVYPREWSRFSVLKAVEHGTRVKRGDLLVAFDAEDLDESIDDLQAQLRLNEIDLTRAQEQLASLEKLTPMDLAANTRNRRIAQEDFDQSMKVLLPLSKEMADALLRMSADSLAYAKEELRQLEKMYKADDLTEESEEIVLRRAKDSLRQAEISYKMAKVRHDQATKFSLPREEQSTKESFRRENLSLDQARILLPLALKRQRLEVQRSKVARERLEKRLKDHRSDRKLMTVTSPIDGVVYLGRCVEGKWTGASPEQFLRGSNLPAEKVFMTVVQTRPLRLIASVSESDLQYVREGVKGVARPTALPDAKLAVVVADVAEAPSAAGSFTAKLTLADPPADPIMPGMTCSIKLLGYLNKEALLAPTTALGTDPLDDDRQFVYVVGKNGKPAKQPVTVGKKSGPSAEILKGLAEGDQILREYPKTPPTETKAEKTRRPGREPAGRTNHASGRAQALRSA